MKSRLVALLLALCLVAGVVPVLAGGPGYLETLWVNNPRAEDRLNLREQMDTESRSLGKYYNGVPVNVYAYLGNGWAGVDIGGMSGVMQTKYLSGSAMSAIPTVYVNNPNPSDRLNLRSMQSEASASLGKYHNGTAVEVWGVCGAWYHVCIDGQVGFMLAKYLTALPGGSGTGGGSPAAADKATVNNPKATDRLNLRTEASKQGACLGKYYNGVQMDVLAYPSADWALVRIAGVEGYVMRQYLATGSAAGKVVSAIPAITVNNPRATDRLNLRGGPSEKAQSLGRYYNGTEVKVLGVLDSGWYHVSVAGRTGYMMAKFLTALP